MRAHPRQLLLVAAAALVLAGGDASAARLGGGGAKFGGGKFSNKSYSYVKGPTGTTGRGPTVNNPIRGHSVGPSGKNPIKGHVVSGPTKYPGKGEGKGPREPNNPKEPTGGHRGPGPIVVSTPGLPVGVGPVIPPGGGFAPPPGGGAPPPAGGSGAGGGSGGAGGGGGNASGVPPAGEQRMVQDEVVVQISGGSQAAINALERRFQLTRLEQQSFQLSGATLIRWRIPRRISVPNMIRQLEANRGTALAFVQPNYLFALQDETQSGAAKPEGGDQSQYALEKMRLPQAFEITKGDNVRVAVIDSGIDINHPELAGVIEGSFDPLGTPEKPHTHGTGIAGIIAAHAKLSGTAPAARILAVRAFGATSKSAEATTFNILKGLDWSVSQNARVINMSFAGPADPVIARSLEAAFQKGIVLVAAAGNAGPKSPPLYPAAYPTVIAVSATDSNDNLFSGSNRGYHVAIAAPGVDIVAPAPDNGYQITTGTSMSAAEISGVVALMLARKPSLTPAVVRAILMSTAKDLGPKGKDDEFGAGLADALAAVMAAEPATASAQALPEDAK